MATYAIGDIQGCFQDFLCLLDKLHFNPDKDQLWLAGDLVNRGPDSLNTLKYCYDLRDNLIAVLGNHDLHLLAVAHQTTKIRKKDTFQDILNSPKRETLLDWLQHCPLMHENREWVMVHAGIYPLWDLDTARTAAREVETIISNSDGNYALNQKAFFNAMYGNHPANWSNKLSGTDRWRTITNFFTRMRMIENNGDIELTYKNSIENAPKHLSPWFCWKNRITLDKKILFGHWAALENNHPAQQVIALDNGCVWGNRLSAYCLETEQWTHCPCNH